MKRLRVAILTHSTNPRGGVVHALAVAEALRGIGDEAVVHAPDPTRGGFFREAACPTVSVAADPVAGGTVDLVGRRIDDYLRHFATPEACDFDVFHAHCGIGGTAPAPMVKQALNPGFVRTVHHVDSFSHPLLAGWKERSIRRATRLLRVGRVWADRLRAEYGDEPVVVGNGVDPSTFRPDRSDRDAALRRRWMLGPGPIVLGVGGFEARKNTATIIDGFSLLRRQHPQAQLVIAGGASLLDHASYRTTCLEILAAHGLDPRPGGPVIVTGPLPQADMPALYRVADVLAFPSWAEGFGLCVLEAMACGTPVIVSHRPPFTEYLADTDALFVDPADPGDLARAMAEALDPAARVRLRPTGVARAAAHSWRACAERHLAAHAACVTQEPIHA